MSAQLIDLDDHRPHVTELQRCTDCFKTQVSTHPADAQRVWWQCMHCGEIAAKAVES